ncbi:MAG: hypothetical protein ACI81P_001139 [Neolewinella sp.]|jgi:hypothetical protein
MATNYITIQQFCSFHQGETVVIEEFLEHDIIEASGLSILNLWVS